MARHPGSDFGPAAASLPRHFELWVPLPPSCKMGFIKTWPTLQRVEKCRILLVPLEGIT